MDLMKSSGLRKGAWSKEEDELLRNCINKYGEGKWSSVSQRAGLKRCRKSCRLRWLNYLSPKITRSKFSDHEIDLLIKLHNLLGNRWSIIAGRIPGRTANDIKNYWNSHLSKKVDNTMKREISSEDHNNKIINDKDEIVRPKPHRLTSTWIWPKIHPQEPKMPTNIIEEEEEEWLNALVTDDYYNMNIDASLDFHGYDMEEIGDAGTANYNMYIDAALITDDYNIDIDIDASFDFHGYGYGYEMGETGDGPLFQQGDTGTTTDYNMNIDATNLVSDDYNMNIDASFDFHGYGNEMGETEDGRPFQQGHTGTTNYNMNIDASFDF